MAAQQQALQQHPLALLRLPTVLRGLGQCFTPLNQRRSMKQRTACWLAWLLRAQRRPCRRKLWQRQLQLKATTAMGTVAMIIITTDIIMMLTTAIIAARMRTLLRLRLQAQVVALALFLGHTAALLSMMVLACTTKAEKRVLACATIMSMSMRPGGSGASTAPTPTTMSTPTMTASPIRCRRVSCWRSSCVQAKLATATVTTSRALMRQRASVRTQHKGQRQSRARSRDQPLQLAQ